MKIPFTVKEFLEVFVAYNQAFWPLHVIMYILAVAVLLFLIIPVKNRERLISAFLFFYWTWMGAAYHGIFFSRINKAAYLFGVLFVVQGIIFFIWGVWKDQFRVRVSLNMRTVAGGIFILYALIIYPILGNYFGHVYPQSPMFGMAPCPTTIFTFGVLLFTAKKIPFYVYLIPLLWSLVGMSAALNLGVPEDYGLAIAGVGGTVLLWMHNRKLKQKQEK